MNIIFSHHDNKIRLYQSKHVPCDVPFKRMQCTAIYICSRFLFFALLLIFFPSNFWSSTKQVLIISCWSLKNTFDARGQHLIMPSLCSCIGRGKQSIRHVSSQSQCTREFSTPNSDSCHSTLIPGRSLTIPELGTPTLVPLTPSDAFDSSAMINRNEGN